MRNRGSDHPKACGRRWGATSVDGTAPTLPTRWLKAADERLVLGGVCFRVQTPRRRVHARRHAVWLLQQRVAFSGDVVHVDRPLGVIPVSQTRPLAGPRRLPRSSAWRRARIVPGHGRVTDLATAQADT